MEDSHRIAHGEIQVLQQRKNEQAARKSRSSPPQTILSSAVLHPCCGFRRIVGSGSCSPESHIPSRRTRDPEITKKISEKTGVSTGQRRGQTARNPASITCPRKITGFRLERSTNKPPVFLSSILEPEHQGKNQGTEQPAP